MKSDRMQMLQVWKEYSRIEVDFEIIINSKIINKVLPKKKYEGDEDSASKINTDRFLITPRK